MAIIVCRVTPTRSVRSQRHLQRGPQLPEFECVYPASQRSSVRNNLVSSLRDICDYQDAEKDTQKMQPNHAAFQTTVTKRDTTAGPAR